MALLERYFARFLQDVELQLNQPDGTPRERLLNHFRAAEQLFTQQGHIVGCLGVKVSAEVCDLSEPMRDALQQGAAKITALYARTLSAAAQQESLSLPHPPEQMAELLSLLWLGASLQSKISREPQPLRLALRTIEQWLKIH